MKEIDLKPLHPKKYSTLQPLRPAEPRLASYYDINFKTLITENLDSALVQYIRK